MSEFEPPFILAIDIGSSAVKGGLYDRTAASVTGAQVSVAHEQDVSNEGAAEEPVERIASAVESAIDQLLAFAEARKLAVSAVALDSMASTVLAVDSEGNALTPVYTYADTRSAPDVDRLRAELDEVQAHQRTGAMQHTSYVPGRVRWLQRTRPDLFHRAVRWMDVSTFLHSRWFGTQDAACSYSIASWSGMLNRQKLCWDDELIRHVGLAAENLPRLVPYSEPMRGLCNEFKTRWPALAEIPFFPAVGDGAAVNVGTGCTSAERVALSVGTTSAMRVLTLRESPVVPGGLWAYRLGRDSTLMGGAFSEGGLLIDWAKDVLQLPALDQLDTAMQGRAPDSHGLTVLPFLAGERATGWATGATGVFEGIRTSTSALDMLQAMMEAVSLRFALVAELLLPARSAETVFVASGGAIRSSTWWLQTMADALDARVVVNSEDQETSRGAAVLALKAIGELDSIFDVAPDVSDAYEPRAAASTVLQEAAKRQQGLYARTLG